MQATRPVNRIGQYTIRSLTTIPGRPVRTIERQGFARSKEVECRMLGLYGNAETWASFSDASVRLDAKKSPVKAN